MPIIIFVFVIFFNYDLYADTSVKKEVFSVPNSLLTKKQVVYDKPLFISDEAANKSYNFDLTNLKENVSINETSMDQLSFNWADLMGFLNIYRLKLNGEGSFYYTTFHNTAEISKLLCKKNCIFHSDIFKALNIYNSEFEQLLSFQGSIFIDNAKVENSVFQGIANFSYITTKNNLSFDNSFFSKELLLNNSKIQGTITFNDAVLPPLIDLSEMELSQNIDLNTMDVSNIHYLIKINLLKTNVNKIKFNYSFFKLYFPPQTTLNLIQTTYSNLLRKFKSEGDMQSYNLLLAEYTEYINLYNKQFIKNIISKYWWDYSTHPEWIFFWMSMFILFYTIINAIFYEKITNRYLDIPFLVESRPVTIRHHHFIHFIYFLPRAFLFTIIMFCGAQFRLGITIYAFKTNSVLMNIYFVFIVLSGLVCLFFLLKYILAQLA